MSSWGDAVDDDEKFDPSITPDFGKDTPESSKPTTPVTATKFDFSNSDDDFSNSDEKSKDGGEIRDNKEEHAHANVKEIGEGLEKSRIHDEERRASGEGHHISLRDKNLERIDWDGEVYTQQHDPNSPIYSKLNSFEELDLTDALLKGVYAMGFKKPSKIQATALPMIVDNKGGVFKDLIAQSQSGTGKTAAFVLGMLCRVDPERKTAQAICLSPARELARQTAEVIQTMAKYTDVDCLVAVPGMRTLARGEKVKEHVIIGTPGTIAKLFKSRAIDARWIIQLVFDEADEMFQRGFRDDSVRIKKALPRMHQTLLFSATYPPEVSQFVSRYLRHHNEVRLKKKDLTLDAIQQCSIDCETDKGDGRFEKLVDIFQAVSLGQVIIFCEKVNTAQTIATKMQEDGHSVSVLYGGRMGSDNHMTPEERDAVIDDFRDSKTKVLITTNVIARGIDIDQVNVVVNYDIPMNNATGRADTDTYLHRIGRTGRFGRKGLSINLCHDNQSRSLVDEIEKFFGHPIKKIPTDDPEMFESMLTL